jgi:hypothetical protein
MLQGEARLGARRIFPGMRTMDIGAAGWIGGGRATQRDGKLQPVWGSCDSALFDCQRETVAWAGAQIVVYGVGSFTHGLQVGAEASWMQLWLTKTDGSLDTSLGLEAPALHRSAGVLLTGAVFGYKYVAPFGLTFNPQFAVGPAIATDGSFAVLPRLALNAGWTF